MELRKEKALIVEEYLLGGTTTRKLAKESGYSRAAISRWVIAEKKAMSKRHQQAISSAKKGEEEMPNDVESLQEALRLARLHISLLEATIDISDEQFGTDLRKKVGTRPSRG